MNLLVVHVLKFYLCRKTFTKFILIHSLQVSEKDIKCVREMKKRPRDVVRVPKSSKYPLKKKKAPKN